MKTTGAAKTAPKILHKFNSETLYILRIYFLLILVYTNNIR